MGSSQRLLLCAPGIQRFRALAIAVLLGGTGCGSALSGVAARGDYPALAPKLAARQAAGDLSDREARVLAHAVLRYEVGAARNEAVSALAGCAAGAEDELGTIAAGDDDDAADAAMLLLEVDAYSVGKAQEHLQDTRDGFRALAVRTLEGGGAADARRRAFVDPAGRVRLAAFRAAIEAADPEDHAALSEAVLKEPLPLARTTALRALVRGRHNPEVTVALLRDLVKRAQKTEIPLAEDAYTAFAQSPFYEAGGRELLERGFANEVAPPTIAGAIAALRLGRDPLRAPAMALLTRALRDGSEREQRFVYAAAPRPFVGELFAVAKVHAVSTDRPLAVLALGALADSGTAAERADALDRLTAYAKPLPEAPRDPVARAARGDLARRKVAAVQQWLEGDLRGDTAAKFAALSGLVSLDRSARAAPLLADSERSVRLATACALVREH